MNELSAEVLLVLMRTSAALTISALAIMIVLRACRIASPAIHRAAYAAALLQGWILFQGTISVPREWLSTSPAAIRTDKSPLARAAAFAAKTLP